MYALQRRSLSLSPVPSEYPIDRWSPRHSTIRTLSLHTIDLLKQYEQCDVSVAPTFPEEYPINQNQPLIERGHPPVPNLSFAST